MNLRIEWQADSFNYAGFRAWIRPLFVHRLGWVVIAFLITLAITDSYYLKALHPGENVTYLLGPACLLGLFFTYFALDLYWFRVRRRRKEPPPIMAVRVFYLTLTDDYAERGTVGWGFVRYHWRLLSGFEENPSRFIVRMSLEEFTIEKSGVKDEKRIGEIRELLKSKLAPSVKT